MSGKCLKENGNCDTDIGRRRIEITKDIFSKVLRNKVTDSTKWLRNRSPSVWQ